MHFLNWRVYFVHRSFTAPFCAPASVYQQTNHTNLIVIIYRWKRQFYNFVTPPKATWLVRYCLNSGVKVGSVFTAFDSDQPFSQLITTHPSYELCTFNFIEKITITKVLLYVSTLTSAKFGVAWREQQLSTSVMATLITQRTPTHSLFTSEFSFYT